jgi:subtilisin family serine protease
MCFIKKLASAFLLITLIGSPLFINAEEIKSIPHNIKNESKKSNDNQATEIIVKLKNKNTQHRLNKENGLEVFLNKNKVIKKDFLNKDDLMLVKGKNTESFEETLNRLKADPDVEYAEPNYKRDYFAILTNDTHRNLLWAIENTGQTINGTQGTIDADMDVLEAWNISEGQGMTVAVIDTGVDYNHLDLQGNMWNGSSCKNELGNSISGGCIHGYDFENNDNDPAPSDFHGTHVAGTIAAIKNNNRGIIGVAPQSKIMAIRFGLDVASEVKAIDFAIQNGVKIINASYGGESYSVAEYEAIQRFHNAGGIFIAAAANASSNNDTVPIYPASYNLPNIISVAASTQNDTHASFSNFGPSSVDISAPGVNIASTYSSNGYVYANGTSMAAPHVAGLAALLWYKYPFLTNHQIKELIKNTGDSIAVLYSLTKTGKRVNANSALLGLVPRIGYSENDIISQSAITYPTDGSGIVSIKYYVTAALPGFSATTTNIEYSLNNGESWESVNLNNVSPFSINSSSTVTKLNFSGPHYTLNWNTKSSTTTSATSTDTARIRFKTSTIASTSPYALTSSFKIDNVAPNLNLDLTTATSTEEDNFLITGTSESGSIIKIIKNGSIISQGNVGTSTNTFAINIPLEYGSPNIFNVIAEDSWGNKTTATSSEITLTDNSAPNAVLTNTPSSGTTDTNASIHVGGNQVVSYKYKLNNGNYSDETPTSTPIILSGLTVGLNTISVIGKDRANNWQSKTTPTTYGWTINATAPAPSSGGGGGGGSYSGGGGGGGGGGGSSGSNYNGSNYSGNTVTPTPFVQPNTLPSQASPTINILPVLSGISTATEKSLLIPPNRPYTFLRTLRVGQRGEDVKALQVFLNQNGFIISSKGSGSPGNESTYFGNATKSALIRYQIAKGIRPASGIFGPLTRQRINNQ